MKGAGLVLLLAAVVYVVTDSPELGTSGATFTARRGELKITVLAGGNVEARESQEIKSEVRGQTKILTIIEEGYRVTPEDVASDKVLVQLDDSEVVQRLTQQEIQFQSSFAQLAEATQQYDIQLKQNESDVKADELAAKFARMDFEKYLGSAIASELLTRLDLDDPVAFMERDTAEEAMDDPASTPQRSRPEIDFRNMGADSRLGGEAQQRLRKLESDISIAQDELKLAENKLYWTEQLFAQEFVPQSDLERDQMNLARAKIGLESARTEQDLFITYEFPKQAEKFLSDYEEALRKLVRTQKQALSKIAQADARLKSAEAQFELQKRQVEELREQKEKCTIVAKRPGLVTYGDNSRWWGSDRIEEGATIRERQNIITIPDMTAMAIKVKVHESAIKKIQLGQRATVKIEAYPDQVLSGEVTKIAVLPSSQDRWMNPDTTMFDTTVSIDGTHAWLKPGMTAEVEILVEALPKTLYVPVQAVQDEAGKRVVYVARATAPEKRVIETGKYNDEFIEVLAGLDEGEAVVLRPPRRVPDGSEGEPPEETGNPAVPVERAEPAAPTEVAHSAAAITP